MTCVALESVAARVEELVDLVGKGDEVLITRDGDPVAKIVAIPGKKGCRTFDSAKGLITFADDLDAPLEDFAEYMNGPPVERIVAPPALGARRCPGSARGLFTIAEDFDAPLEDFAEYM